MKTYFCANSQFIPDSAIKLVIIFICIGVRPPPNGLCGDASGTGLDEGVGAGVLNADCNIET